MIMLDTNKEVYWFGSSGHLIDQAFPIQFDFAKYLPDLFGDVSHAEAAGQSGAAGGQFSPYILGSQQQDFAIVKINASWSTSMSTMMIADLRAVNQESSHSKLISTLKNLGSKWDPKDVMPPYIDIVANLFPANIMRKPAVIKTGASLSTPGARLTSTAGATQGVPTSAQRRTTKLTGIAAASPGIGGALSSRVLSARGAPPTAAGSQTARGVERPGNIAYSYGGSSARHSTRR